MARDVSGWLANQIGPVVIRIEGVDQTPASAINFDGCSATFDDSGDISELTITPDSGAAGDADFDSGELRIANPLGTFWYTFAGGAIVADRTITLPLLGAPDTLVAEAFAQTLTNKTINGASNTLAVRIASDVTGLGTGVATFLGTPSGTNLASALTSALPDTKGGTGLTALGSGVATFLGTPTGANLASALSTALPDSKGGTGLTALGAGVATFLSAPSGSNLASALSSALPDTKGGTGLSALGSGVATMLGTFSSANIKTACTDETGSGGSLVFATSPTLTTPVINGQVQGPVVAIAALAIDWSLGTGFTKTLSAGSNTFTFSNQASNMQITVRLTGAASTVTWPTVKWAAGAAPTQTASGIDVYTFWHDGTSVYGSVVQAMA